MCLTGVDYFSTLGYQPGIAFLAAGALSPIATMVLVLLTLFGALPIYNRVAAESPHGNGSISMLEHLLPGWQAKLFVLVLLGFVATDFIITITLSAADATAHIVENPFTPHFLRNRVAITLFLIGILGAIFLKGVAFYELATHPSAVSNWRSALITAHGNPLGMIGVALIVFPKLALGLSGFETGVVVMPLVKGYETDTEENPVGRIINTRKLLRTAALIMSVMLITSSFVTTTLIPAAEFAEGGEANGRALAYIAHRYLGNMFGTVYDLSTILILSFAGASAMAGLVNIVPRYLPRYGMAPKWAAAVRPLVLVYTAIAFAVTAIFKADVEAQGGAYATGVLVLMSSAAVAVTLSAFRRRRRGWAFLLIALVFAYTTILNIIERPEGIKIASFFIGSIIVASFVSRVMRTTELRVERIELDEKARAFIEEVARKHEIRLVANRRQEGDVNEYRLKEKEQREDNHIPKDDPILFLEIDIGDASEFSEELCVKGVEVNGYRVLRGESAAVPNAIAALLLYLRDTTGKIPHAYFGWSEGNPLKYLMRYLLFGEGETAPVTREVLRQAEPDPERRPSIHAGG
ncbi:MAG: amino acid transporter [Acidobacteria bacterium]|nr:MAG: amino acid transporter [Acidobacteriota bacterium]